MLEPPELPALSLLIRATSPTRLVSLLYASVQASTTTMYSKARLDWQSELGVPITDEIWRFCCEQTKKISLNGKHRLAHLKFLNRVHYTPVRLFRYGLRDTDKCDRCPLTGADFLHVAWDCPLVASFWVQVFQDLTDITGLSLDPDPVLALLGYTKPLPKAVRKLVAMGLVLAKRRVAIRWMRGPAPKISDWHKDMLFCHTQTETYSELLPPASRPKSFWSLYVHYNITHQATANTQDQ